MGFRHAFVLSDEKRACIEATAGKSSLLLSQGISVSIPLEAENSGSLILIAEGKHLLRCLWQIGLRLQSKARNQLSSRDVMGCTKLF